MRMFQLDDRLRLCAEMVREGSLLADIGTDHAYLPIWLVAAGKCPGAVAVDVREGPLERARENVVRYHMEEQIRLSLSSGLSALGPEDADDIVIAGMGGELIAEILGAAPWGRDSEKRLILQPMTTAPELRCWLRENGFGILQEKCAVSDGKAYTVLQVAYSPDMAREAAKDPLYPYAGALTGNTPEEQAYLSRTARQLESRKKGLLHQGNSQEAAKLERILALLYEKIGEKQERM